MPGRPCCLPRNEQRASVRCSEDFRAHSRGIFYKGRGGGGKYGVTNYLSDPCSTTEKVVELCPASLARSQRRRMKGGYSRSQPSPSVEQGLQSMLLFLKEVVPLG